MSFEGTMLNGTVVFAERTGLPDGTVVDAVVKAPEVAQPTFLGLMKLAGSIKNLPADFADEHDHNIYGTNERGSSHS